MVRSIPMIQMYWGVLMKVTILIPYFCLFLFTPYLSFTKVASNKQVIIQQSEKDRVYSHPLHFIEKMFIFIKGIRSFWKSHRNTRNRTEKCGSLYYFMGSKSVAQRD
jgi:hypothetical protein